MNDDDFYDDAPATPQYGVDLPGKPRGRYIFPDPPGYVRKPGATAGFMRMTNLASAFSDQRRLQLWRERMIMLGLRTPEGETLLDEFMALDIAAMEPELARHACEEYADKIANAAGAGHGARRGTARHVMLQTMMETGVLTGTRTMRLQWNSLEKALVQHHLEPIPGWSERRVCNLRYNTIGTLDLGVRCLLSGQVGILDLKTQRGFWSHQEAAGQQEGYDSAEWTWEGPPDSSGSWVRRPVEWNLTGVPGGDFEGRRVALLAHMPQEPGPNQLPVRLVEVDLSYGRDVMEQALNNIRLRSIGKSEARGRRVGWMRPVPQVARV